MKPNHPSSNPSLFTSKLNGFGGKTRTLFNMLTLTSLRPPPPPPHPTPEKRNNYVMVIEASTISASPETRTEGDRNFKNKVQMSPAARTRVKGEARERHEPNPKQNHEETHCSWVQGWRIPRNCHSLSAHSATVRQYVAQRWGLQTLVDV